MYRLWQSSIHSTLDAVIYDHLSGECTLGVFPLLTDDTCHFAVDFDEADWKEDTQALAQSCQELGVRFALEISRSGKGARAWVFFSDIDFVETGHPALVRRRDDTS